jgi:hypothetical protein
MDFWQRLLEKLGQEPVPKLLFNQSGFITLSQSGSPERYSRLAFSKLSFIPLNKYFLVKESKSIEINGTSAFDQ